MAMSANEANRIFQRANAVVTQVQSPESRPHSVTVEVRQGQYTVRTYTETTQVPGSCSVPATPAVQNENAG